MFDVRFCLRAFLAHHTAQQSTRSILPHHKCEEFEKHRPKGIA
jgi:hypothetical protein